MNKKIQQVAFVSICPCLDNERIFFDYFSLYFNSWIKKDFFSKKMEWMHIKWMTSNKRVGLRSLYFVKTSIFFCIHTFSHITLKRKAQKVDSISSNIIFIHFFIIKKKMLLIYRVRVSYSRNISLKAKNVEEQDLIQLPVFILNKQFMTWLNQFFVWVRTVVRIKNLRL